MHGRVSPPGKRYGPESSGKQVAGHFITVPAFVAPLNTASARPRRSDILNINICILPLTRWWWVQGWGGGGGVVTPGKHSTDTAEEEKGNPCALQTILISTDACRYFSIRIHQKTRRGEMEVRLTAGEIYALFFPLPPIFFSIIIIIMKVLTSLVILPAWPRMSSFVNTDKSLISCLRWS